MKILNLFLFVILVSFAKQGDGNYTEEFIHSGFNARSEQFPFQVLMIFSGSDKRISICGGSLISTEYILTAAHCLNDVIQMTVYMGMYDLNQRSNAVQYDIKLSDLHPNPQFCNETMQDDIGIIKLPQTVILNRFIQTIDLPLKVWASPSTFDNFVVSISGWGKSFPGDKLPHRILQFSIVYKMPQISCINAMRELGVSVPITDKNLCTDNRIYAGTCPGDSGGPLTVKLKTSLITKQYLIGITSWILSPCGTNAPYVFVNVPYYLDWINNITGIPIS